MIIYVISVDEYSTDNRLTLMNIMERKLEINFIYPICEKVSFSNKEIEFRIRNPFLLSIYNFHSCFVIKKPNLFLIVLSFENYDFSGSHIRQLMLY